MCIILCIILHYILGDFLVDNCEIILNLCMCAFAFSVYSCGISYVDYANEGWREMERE